MLRFSSAILSPLRRTRFFLPRRAFSYMNLLDSFKEEIRKEHQRQQQEQQRKQQEEAKNNNSSNNNNNNTDQKAKKDRGPDIRNYKGYGIKKFDFVICIIVGFSSFYFADKLFGFPTYLTNALTLIRSSEVAQKFIGKQIKTGWSFDWDRQRSKLPNEVFFRMVVYGWTGKGTMFGHATSQDQGKTWKMNDLQILMQDRDYTRINVLTGETLPQAPQQTPPLIPPSPRMALAREAYQGIPPNLKKEHEQALKGEGDYANIKAPVTVQTTSSLSSKPSPPPSSSSSSPSSPSITTTINSEPSSLSSSPSAPASSSNSNSKPIPDMSFEQFINVSSSNAGKKKPT